MSGLRGLIAGLALGVAALTGCSGESVVGDGDGATAGPCVTGQVVACPCLGGGSGVQTCLGAAGFGACQCPGVDAGVFDGAWSDGVVVNDLAPSTDQASVSDGMVAPDAGSADGSVVPWDVSTADVVTADVPTAARTIGPAGGVVALDGVRLEVPAGALSAETMIRITATTLPAPAGYTLYSPVYRFEPEGTVFARPVSLTLPFTGDVRLATAFWSRPSAMGGGYERLGGIPSASSITFSATHFSTGFVANGVDYTETADRSCVQTRLLDTRYGSGGGVAAGTGIPAGVALFFSVDDCQGRPIVGLTSADFTPTEDGSPVGSEGSGAVLPSAGQQVFVTLSIDLSSSTRPVLSNVIAAAIALVDKFEERRVPVQVGIDVFAGEATINAWQRHTLDLALVRTRLRALGSFTPEDASSTNLYGAIVQGVGRLEAAEAAFETRNAGGALALGYLVVFTDGADTSARVTIAAAQAAAGQRRNQVMALGLAGTDFTAAARTALQQVAGSGFVEAPSTTVLDREFGYLATRIAGQAQRTYLLGYCSPRRSGTHRVGVTVRGATTRGEDGQFDATGFGPGCSVSSFTSACSDAQCGGLGCGACDDRTDVCSEATRRCVSNCLVERRCGGDTLRNRQGYDQRCPDQPGSERCPTACTGPIDAGYTDVGFCRSECAVPADTGTPTCGSICADLGRSRDNCGACGNRCRFGCRDGACVGLDRVYLNDSGSRSCAWTSGGAAYCWEYSTSASLAVFASDVVEFASFHTLTYALTSEGIVQYWVYGSPMPTQVGGVGRAIDIDSNYSRMCAVRSDHTVWCWGVLPVLVSASPEDGGTRPTIYANDPTRIPELTDAAQVAVGGDYTCVITTAGTVRCIGYNTNGELGGGSTDYFPGAVAAVGLTDVIQLSGYDSYMCAISGDHLVRCWGNYSPGRVPYGDAGVVVQSTPTLLPGLGPVRRLSSYGRQQCAAMMDGTARCWGGSNSYGQIGDGTRDVRLTPTTVAGLTGVVDIVTSDQRACAVRSNGQVYCWGRDSGYRAHLNAELVSFY